MIDIQAKFQSIYLSWLTNFLNCSSDAPWKFMFQYWIEKIGPISLILKDNLPHNTCQIYVKPHSKSTQMTLEYHIFDEKALE